MAHKGTHHHPPNPSQSSFLFSTIPAENGFKVTERQKTALIICHSYNLLFSYSNKKEAEERHWHMILKDL